MELNDYLRNFNSINNLCENLDKLHISYKIYDSNKLMLLKYDKENSDMNNPIVRCCRGILISTENNIFKIVCSPPQKSDRLDLNLEELIENWAGIKIEDFIDGTMINLFYHGSENETDCIDNWNISTRSCLYATCNWYTDKQFKTMFEEAVKNNPINYETLNKKFTYTFVLQHPDNRIVTKYIKPNIVLVNLYDIENIENINLEKYITDYLNKYDTFPWNVPKNYKISSFDSLNCMLEKMEYQQQGFILKYNNKRFKIRNIFYEDVKKLRGDTNLIELRYIQLRRNKRIKVFLNYFPEFNATFRNLENNIYKITNEIYNLYQQKFIKKEQIIIPEIYKDIIYKLHGIFINFKQNRTQLRIFKKDVIELINSYDEYKLYNILKIKILDTE